MKKNFRWAVTRPRRNPVATALLAPRLKSTKSVTMPTRTMTMLTDAECGLPEDPVAQIRAEEAIRAAISYRLRQEAKASPVQIQAVEIPIEDESITILDVPVEVLDGIAAELRRIVSRPFPDIRLTAHRGQTTTRTPA
ncbi:UNVERIFIED_ORG: hypothetical protein J2W74_002011 [Methylorubrum zatmanii]